MKTVLACLLAFVASFFLAFSASASSVNTFTAGGTITQFERVTLSGANVIEAGAADEDVGIALGAATSTNIVPVKSFVTGEIGQYLANGAITAGADVYPAASGLVSATVAGKRIGKALNATTNSGDACRVLLFSPATDRVVISRSVNASSVDETVFIADRAYQAVVLSEVHAVASSSGTLAIRKVTDTSAPGAAASSTVKEFMTGTISTAGTANTTVAGTLSATPADYTLATGDRICFKFGGTITGLAGGNVTLVLKPK